MSNVRSDFTAIARKLRIRCIYDRGSRDALDGLELLAELTTEELHVFDAILRRQATRAAR